MSEGAKERTSEGAHNRDRVRAESGAGEGSFAMCIPEEHWASPPRRADSVQALCVAWREVGLGQRATWLDEAGSVPANGAATFADDTAAHCTRDDEFHL
eukprot:3845601-Pyramimonas_sp.AAC.4